MLTFLTHIALFLERALDVFILTWRGLKSKELDREIQKCTLKLSMLKVEANEESEFEKILNKLDTAPVGVNAFINWQRSIEFMETTAKKVKSEV